MSWRAPLLVAVLAFALYAATCAPGVLWGDSATYQARVARGQMHSSLGLALAHPLYVLTARAWTALPLGEIAYRVNLFSAFCAALALALVFQMVRRLTHSVFAAVVSAIFLGLTHTFWTHAVIAEVYALYALALTAELCLLERYFSTARRGFLAAALFVNGLNLCNHLFAILHLPGYLALVLWLLHRRRISWLHLPGLLAAWAAGASLYLGMIAAHIAANGDPVRIINEALTGQSFDQRIVPHGFPWRVQSFKTVAAFLLNFPTPLVLLCIPGLAVWRADHPRRPVLLFAVMLMVINVAFGFVYLVPDQYVFFFPTYVLACILAGLGARRFARSPSRRAACLVAAMLPAAIYEIAPTMVQNYPALEHAIGSQGLRKLPGRRDYVYFLRPRKNGEYSASRFCTGAFQTAGSGALILADSTIKSPLVYCRDVLGISRDSVMQAGGEVEPLPPTSLMTAAAIRRYATAGNAYICDNTPRWTSKWIPKVYDLQPVGQIFRLQIRPAPQPSASQPTGTSSP